MVNSRERFALRPRLGELRRRVLLRTGGAPHEGGVPAAEVELCAPACRHSSVC